MPGLAKQAHALGARAITAAVTGAYTNNELFDRVASMLKMGMLSTETRYTNNINAKGLSASADFWTGGADRVFAQMITEKNCKDGMGLDKLYYYSKVQMLISLDALETGTYQYPHDSFGTRKVDPWSPYTHRPSITEFINHQQNSPWVYGGHEVMFRGKDCSLLLKRTYCSRCQHTR